MSSEPKRSSAYSDDLRWKIVWEYEAMGLSAEQVAKNLCIDSSTVYRIVRQFDSTGTVSKKAYSATNRPTKMTASIQLVLLHLVMSRPGIYLWEIREELKSQYGLDVSISTIYNCLKKTILLGKKCS